MKNKGVMISLAALVLVGMMITTGTHNFIEKNSAAGTEATPQVTAAAMDKAVEEKVTEGALPEEMFLAAGGENGAPAKEEGAPENAPEGRQAEGEAQDLVGSKEAYSLEEDADTGEDMPRAAALTSGMWKSSPPASPMETDGMPEAMAENLEKEAAVDIVSAESQSYYVKRLQDLDSQIRKNKESQTGANVNSSVKSAAASELKLWDSELNDIYNAVLDRLGQEESEELVKEERAWLKERDSLAMDAAKKSAGGSSESLEYTMSLIESTRQRAYELAGRYAQVLEE